MIRKLFLSATILCMLASCNDKNNSTIVNIAKDNYTLPGDTLFPEGIAFNAKTNLFYTGSSTTGDILQINAASGAVTTLAAGATQNRKVATGMKLDIQDRLWICGGADNKIHVLNLNGSVLKTWDTKTLFGSGFINDCIVDNTNVYFTDSQVRKIYRANANESTPSTLEEWLTFTDAQIPFAATGTNANGIVNTPDNKYLIIVVSTSGKLYRIDKTTKAITEITLNTPVTNGDGMYMDNNILYVSRNANNLIYPVTLNADYSQGTVGNGFGTGLLFNTTIAKADRYFLAVNGQLNKRTTPPTPVLPFSITRVAIP